MGAVWRRRALTEEAEIAQSLATQFRRRQVRAADGTPSGDIVSAVYREVADSEEEAAAALAARAARPWFARLPYVSPDVE